MVAATTTLFTPDLSAGSTVQPLPCVVVVDVWQPGILVVSGGVVSVSVIEVVMAMEAVALVVTGTALPGTIPAPVALPAVEPVAGATVEPSTIGTLTALASPETGASTFPAPYALTLYLTLLAALLRADSQTGTPTIDADVTIVPPTVVLPMPGQGDVCLSVEHPLVELALFGPTTRLAVTAPSVGVSVSRSTIIRVEAPEVGLTVESRCR